MNIGGKSSRAASESRQKSEMIRLARDRDQFLQLVTGLHYFISYLFYLFI